MTSQDFAQSVITKAVGLNKTAKKYKAILESGHIKERDLISLKSAMQGNRNAPLVAIVKEVMKNREITIELSHQQKGIDYLKKLWLTPMGKERKNNPFGSYHEDIIRNYSHFTLSEIRNVSTNDFAHYVSVFKCYSRNGASFEYYWNGAGITIV